MGSSPSSQGNCELLIHSEVLTDSQIREKFEIQAQLSVYGVRYNAALVHHGFIVTIKHQRLKWSFDWCMNHICRKRKGIGLRGKLRAILGIYKIKVIWQAIEYASRGRKYDTYSYNCNHWANKFGKYLKWDLQCGGLVI